MLVPEYYRCEGCEAEIREYIATSPFAFSPAQPWIHRRYSRLHFCSQECAVAFAEQQRERHDARRRGQPA